MIRLRNSPVKILNRDLCIGKPQAAGMNLRAINTLLLFRTTGAG